MSQQHSELEQVTALALTLSPLDKIRLVEQIMATLEQEFARTTKTPKRSVYGIWSDVQVSEEDITEARREMWGNFPHEDV